MVLATFVQGYLQTISTKYQINLASSFGFGLAILQEGVMRNTCANFDYFLISSFREEDVLSKLLTTVDVQRTTHDIWRWMTDTALYQKLTMALCARWAKKMMHLVWSPEYIIIMLYQDMILEKIKLKMKFENIMVNGTFQ